MRCNHALARSPPGISARGFALNEGAGRCLACSARRGRAGWQGEDPAGRTILVHDEGGFGDTLQFVPLRPAAGRARGAGGAAGAAAAGAPAAAHARGSAAVLARGAALPGHDLHCPMLSLPHCFGTSLRNRAGAVPYLPVDPRGGALAGAAGGGSGCASGWSGPGRPGRTWRWRTPWTGAARCRRRRWRRWRAFPACGSCRCKRTGRCGDAARGLDLRSEADCADFDDTAAVVAGLDLVIAVDTAVAHLAGGLGRPVWLLSRYDTCWRWLAGGATALVSEAAAVPPAGAGGTGRRCCGRSRATSRPSSQPRRGVRPGRGRCRRRSPAA